MHFLAVSLEPDAKIVQKAATALQLRWPVASTRIEVLDPFGVKFTPATVWVDPNGKIVSAASGPRSFDFFEARTKELLK